MPTENIPHWNIDELKSWETPENIAKRDVREISEKYQQEISEQILKLKVTENA